MPANMSSLAGQAQLESSQQLQQQDYHAPTSQSTSQPGSSFPWDNRDGRLPYRGNPSGLWNEFGPTTLTTSSYSQQPPSALSTSYINTNQSWHDFGGIDTPKEVRTGVSTIREGSGSVAPSMYRLDSAVSSNSPAYMDYKEHIFQQPVSAPTIPFKDQTFRREG
jgi:hypothetical protein